MTNKKLGRSAAALHAQLLGATPDQRAKIAEQYELKCDFSSANQFTEERAKLEMERDAIAARLSKLVVQEGEALISCVQDYTLKLEPGWFTPEFVGRMDTGEFKRRLSWNEKITMEELFTRVNQGIPLSDTEGCLLSYLYDNGTMRLEDRQRLANILWVAERGHVCGRSYGFTRAQAKRLCDWALPYWREEPGAKVPRSIRHDGSTYEIEIHPTYVAIGCQLLHQKEVVRIATLFGWGGQTQMIGPEYREEETKKPKRSRSKEPVAA